uniref:HDC01368 n=1 Tax=Drosophila melanogaster TaxID=7227 RepID=Q6IHS0_DROME|nr:TPA_inf: HDC01368 [Drosophila melanogaster]
MVEQQESFIYATSCANLYAPFAAKREAGPEDSRSIGGLWLSSFVCDLHKMTLGWYISGSKCLRSKPSPQFLLVVCHYLRSSASLGCQAARAFAMSIRGAFAISLQLGRETSLEKELPPAH